jgi:hypothetical protein
MTTLTVSHSFAIRILARFLGKKPKSKQSVEEPTVKNYETFNEYKGDVMDYDGMGNYGRFPCEK